MSAVAPIGSTPDYLPRQEKEPEPVPQAERAGEVKTPTEVKSDAVKQAEQTTLYDFRYTGKGSFIDKVF
ncbi:hypothetical protein DND132_0493 [Pseudodesulfovibrio mercurii]|uniref:Uncharacterized protein n=1 Tax=Pseudodesulfovibrio mercurii TaxID=641491 RepID=F0JFN2_9BACT|nr:hypothetical protein [Pseudodesulfovibrio mercurii]EGB13710.1 hypothetical protein DND132_0493 [Pseudodesulfovibrio mercurii]